MQMGLASLRDISVIETPPAGRRSILTHVGPYDEDLVRRAMERELARGGQTFFVHNRVESIDEVAERLRSLVPDATFVTAHGQMPERALEGVMRHFLDGRADVLVTTTIVESGLDVASANTLIVDRADAMGLAQLYQLRGRIGRSSQQGYAYLFAPLGATVESQKRLEALMDFTELGSGFAIAMRDLEIRGAGNLSGPSSRATSPPWASRCTCSSSRRPSPRPGARRPGARSLARSSWSSRWTPTCRPSTLWTR
jgi:transcription-repair coupling factor (superfamily II helicase)